MLRHMTVVVGVALVVMSVHKVAADPTDRPSVRSRLTLEAYSSAGADEVCLRLGITALGPRSLWPFAAENRPCCFVNGQRDRSFEEWDTYLRGRHLQLGESVGTYLYRTEEDLRALLGPGRHAMRFEMGPASSSALVFNVPSSGSVWYRPRYALGVQKGGGKAMHDALADGPLHRAVWAGDELAVRQFLQEPAAALEANSLGQTPLHYACLRGFPSIAALLIEGASDVNRSDHAGRSPLHEAALHGDVGIAELLLGAGAEVDVRDGLNRSPLDMACRWRRTETAALLLRSEASHDVFSACASGELALLDRLLSEDPGLADSRYPSYHPDERDWPELTHAEQGAANAADAMPLDFAVAWGQAEVVAILLARGADPNGWVEGRRSPLYHACRLGHTEIVSLLLGSGADIEPDTAGSEAPLHGAIRALDVGITSVLLTAGADPEATDRNGFTPLHYAAERDSVVLTRVLIAAGADVNARADAGRTALHEAASGGSAELVVVLIEAGADVSATWDTGFTPLHEAGSVRVAELLLANGADVAALDESGYTAARRAAADGRQDVALFLVRHAAGR